MSKVLPFVALLLALALLLGGCADSVSPDFSFGPITTEPGESPTPQPSAEKTLSPQASQTLPTAEETPLPEASETPPPVDTEASIWGELSGDQYVNKAFGFTVTIPEGWELASKEEIALASGFAADLMETVEDIDSHSAVAVTLMICRPPIGSTTGFGPNITIAYNGNPDERAFTNDFLFNMLLYELEELYTDAYAQVYPNPSVSVSGERNTVVNGKEYVKLITTTVFDGGTMYQEQYLTKTGDGMLSFTATYFDTADKAVTDVFMQSIVFE